MPSKEERAHVNEFLMSQGLGKLTDPGLVPQLGFLIGMSCRDHASFRDMLNRCEPAERHEMYEAVRSYLRFEVKPLDVYISELAQAADIKQLPLVAADGSLQPYKVIDIQTRQPLEEKTGALAEAQNLIEFAAAHKTLTLVCARCTREQTFPGWNKDATVTKAREAGWRFDGDSGKEYCPAC